MNLIPQERDGRKVLFGIRPEHLEPCAESEAMLVVEVDLIEPLGADTLVYGHVGGRRADRRTPAFLGDRARRQAAAALRPGAGALLRRGNWRAFAVS